MWNMEFQFFQVVFGLNCPHHMIHLVYNKNSLMPFNYGMFGRHRTILQFEIEQGQFSESRIDR